MFKRFLLFVVGEKVSTRIALCVFLFPSLLCLTYALAGPYFGARVTYEPNRENRGKTGVKRISDVEVSPVVETGQRVSDATLLLLTATTTLRKEAFSGRPCQTVLDLQARMRALNAIPPGFSELADGGFKTNLSSFGLRVDPKRLRVEVYSAPLGVKGPVDFFPEFVVRFPSEADRKGVPGDQPFAEIIWNDGRVRQPGPPSPFLSPADLKALGWKVESLRLTAKDRKDGIQ